MQYQGKEGYSQWVTKIHMNCNNSKCMSSKMNSFEEKIGGTDRIWNSFFSHWGS